MAENLDLAIVLKAILDAKGFEQAQAAIKGLAKQANDAAGPLDKAGDKQKKLGESFGGTRGPVADLTRILLQNIGVTGAAGETAKAAGTAMYFMEGAATAAAVATTAGVAAVALLIPHLIAWWNRTQALSEETRRVVDTLGSLGGQIADLIRDVPMLEAEYGKLSDTLHELALMKEADQAAEMRAAIVELEKALGKVGPQASLWLDILKQTRPEMMAYATTADADSEAARKLRAQINAASAALALHNEAARQGITIEELLAQKRRDGTQAMRDATEATKEAIEEKLRVMQNDIDLINAVTDEEQNAADIADQQERDAENDMKAAGKRQNKQYKDGLQAETDYQLAVARLNRYGAESAEEAARRKQQAANATLAATAQALASLSVFFGNNKALAIAAAIVDTYAAANQVLKDPSLTGQPYLRFALAAAAIASGLANVQSIRKAQPGFDDPFSDALANQLGRKSAADFVKHFGAGFQGAMFNASGGGGSGGTTVYDQRTYNTGTTIRSMTMPGYLGSGRTEFWKHAKRQMDRVNRRVERRTGVGRS